MIMGASNDAVFFCKVKDNYNTPTIAFKFLLSNLAIVPKYIWAPFYFDGSLKTNLRGICLVDVIHVNENFFEYEPKQYDCIIDTCLAFFIDYIFDWIYNEFILNTMRFLLNIHFRVAFVTDACMWMFYPGGPAFSIAFFIEYIFVCFWLKTNCIV